MRLLLMLLALMLATDAVAAPRCADQEQAIAEQGLALHSELMVIALTCQYSGHQPLMPLYTRFGQRHGEALRRWEKQIVRSNGGAVRKLDRLRTEMANQVAMQIAHEGPQRFCARMAGMVPTMAAWGTEGLAAELRRRTPSCAQTADARGR